MSIQRIDRLWFHSDGRMRGSYVYMLLCRDDGPIYVKVGITDKPTERLKTLRNGCPVTPRRYAFVEVRSRWKAKLMEADLHAALAKWRAHGEWFRLSLPERDEFNAVWQQIFRAHEELGWTLKWEQISVARFVRYLERRRRYFQRQWRRRGKAYQDFKRACDS